MMPRRRGPEGLQRRIFPMVHWETPIYSFIREDGEEVSHQRALTDAIEALPEPRMKLVIQGLYELESRGRTVSELARRLGISPETVRSQEKRALRQLAKHERLKKFFAPTAQEVAEMKERIQRTSARVGELQEENRELRVRNAKLEQNQQLLLKAFREAGVKEPSLNDIRSIEEQAKDGQRLKQAVEAVTARAQQRGDGSAATRVTNALRRPGDICTFTEFEAKYQSGEISRLRNIGPKGMDLVEEILEEGRKLQQG